MNFPKFKLCVSCMTYNQSSYITDAMNGFSMQLTNFPFVCCIVDDASTDGEQDTIKEYLRLHFDLDKKSDYYESETDYAKITYARHKKNANCFFVVLFLKENLYSKKQHFKKIDYISEWRNSCEFEALCEGDDYWIDPLKLQKQVDLLEKNPRLSYCFTNRIEYNEITGKRIFATFDDRKYTIEDFLAGFNPGIQSVVYRKCAYEKNFNVAFRGKVNGDRMIPYYCLHDGFAKCLQETTAVYRISGFGVSTKLSKVLDAKGWFIHTTNDFYNFHKTVGFPSKKAYTKKMGAEIIKFIRVSKSISLKCIYRQTAKYQDIYSFVLFVSICTEAFKYGLNKTIIQLRDKFTRICKKTYNRFNFSRFSSYVLCMGSSEIYDISQMPIVYGAITSGININNGSTTKADAFLYSNDKSMWLFYELQKFKDAKGLIYAVKTEDGVNWSHPKCVLEERCHLSFPFVFEDHNHIYMIPETSTMGEIRLYEGSNNCDNFKFVKTMMSGARYVDSCVYLQNGVYYLFTSVQHNDNAYTLKLYTSDTLLGEWHEHPSSPISTGKCRERNAGSIVIYKGMILRPAQESRSFYGQNTHLFRITELSPTIYHEEPYALDIITRGWNECHGGHQLSMCKFKGKDYVAVDVLQDSLNLKVIINRIVKKL